MERNCDRWQFIIIIRGRSVREHVEVGLGTREVLRGLTHPRYVRQIWKALEVVGSVEHSS
jgi:hypothetical protein